MNYDSFSHKQFHLFCDSKITEKEIIDAFEESFRVFEEKKIPQFSRKEVNEIFLLFGEDNSDYFSFSFDEGCRSEKIVLIYLIERDEDFSKWIVNVSDRDFYVSLVMKEVEQYLNFEQRDKISQISLECEICLFSYEVPRKNFSIDTLRGYVPSNTKVFDLKDIFETFSSLDNTGQKSWKRNTYPLIIFSKSRTQSGMKMAFITFCKNTGDALAARQFTDKILVNDTECNFDFAYDKIKQKSEEPAKIFEEEIFIQPSFEECPKVFSPIPKFGAKIKPIMASL